MTIKLTPSQEQIQVRLKEIREILRVNALLEQPLHNEFRELRRSCTHVVVCSGCKTNEGKICPEYVFGHLGAECLACGERFDGWFCPDSPDHLCIYYSYKDDEGRFVYLLNNIKYRLPVTHNARYETEDSCLFCGEPEERK